MRTDPLNMTFCKAGRNISDRTNLSDPLDATILPPVSFRIIGHVRRVSDDKLRFVSFHFL
jgi:hypothetical protein